MYSGEDHDEAETKLIIICRLEAMKRLEEKRDGRPPLGLKLLAKDLRLELHGHRGLGPRRL